MQKSHWQNCWDGLETPWKSEAGEIDLVKYLQNNKPEPIGLKALVPLCGDSEATRILFDHGYDVTGVELIESAIKHAISTLFSELTFKRCKSNRIAFIQGNILTEELPENNFDLIYDRAALVALEPSQRENYSKKLISWLRPSGRLIFVGLDYPQPEEQSAPYSITKEEADFLFKDLEKIETTRESTAAPPKRYQERGVKEMKVFCTHYVKHLRELVDSNKIEKTLLRPKSTL